MLRARLEPPQIQLATSAVRPVSAVATSAFAAREFCCYCEHPFAIRQRHLRRHCGVDILSEAHANRLAVGGNCIESRRESARENANARGFSWHSRRSARGAR